MIEPHYPTVSLARQCALLGLARSSFYYAPVPECAENLRLMRRLDELYTALRESADGGDAGARRLGM
jgi:putative transposase